MIQIRYLNNTTKILIMKSLKILNFVLRKSKYILNVSL